MEYCLSHGIAVTAYGSLGGSHNKAQSNAVAEVARIHGVTSAQACLVPRPGPAVEPATLCSVAVPGARTSVEAVQNGRAQVLLRWATSQGIAVIPGATSAEHIRENLNLPPFALSEAERDKIANSQRPRTFKAWGNLESQRHPKLGKLSRRLHAR